MAAEDRTATRGLELFRQLQREPYRFDFFQLLRQLECIYDDQPRLAESPRAADDPVRLGQEPSMAFAPSTVSAFAPGEDGMPPRIDVLFFGLFGPNGPLPLHLTEYARERLHNLDDPTFIQFANVFHHRLLSLFYRAWADAQPTVQYDRPATDRFADYVGSLFGIGMPGFRRRDAIPDNTKLHFSGWLSCQTRHADGLQAILSDFFRLPVCIDEFIGQWIAIPEDSRFVLGGRRGTPTLGAASPIGSEIWDCQHKFRVVFGPLGLDDYCRMLPGGDSLQRLMSLVRNYIGDELQWDLWLILKREEVPPMVLGQQCQLGWTSWLDHESLTRDANDLFLEPMIDNV